MCHGRANEHSHWAPRDSRQEERVSQAILAFQMKSAWRACSGRRSSSPSSRESQDSPGRNPLACAQRRVGRRLILAEHRLLTEILGSRNSLGIGISSAIPSKLSVNPRACSLERLRQRWAGSTPISLYKNNRDGTFSDVTGKAVDAGGTLGMGAAIGGYDNDGYPARRSASDAPQSLSPTPFAVSITGIDPEATDQGRDRLALRRLPYRAGEALVCRRRRAITAPSRRRRTHSNRRSSQTLCRPRSKFR